MFIDSDFDFIHLDYIVSLFHQPNINSFVDYVNISMINSGFTFCSSMNLFGFVFIRITLLR